jgi:hypothetical protein
MVKMTINTSDWASLSSGRQRRPLLRDDLESAAQRRYFHSSAHGIIARPKHAALAPLSTS